MEILRTLIEDTEAALVEQEGDCLVAEAIELLDFVGIEVNPDAEVGAFIETLERKLAAGELDEAFAEAGAPLTEKASQKKKPAKPVKAAKRRAKLGVYRKAQSKIKKGWKMVFGKLVKLGQKAMRSGKKVAKWLKKKVGHAVKAGKKFGKKFGKQMKPHWDKAKAAYDQAKTDFDKVRA